MAGQPPGYNQGQQPQQGGYPQQQQGYPPQQQPYGQPGYGPPQQQGIPGLVIAGAILAILPICPLIGIILAAVGLGEAKRRNAGVGLAQAAIGVGILWIVLSIIVRVVAAS